mmetsp:Transcript_7971/g.18197  ORF Transcript_7971/g.18197 Transcript_7971/m.18197 type:complete len:300 (-) Transcript_7971:211-1110(-)
MSDTWVDFAAGWVSGGTSVLACQPIDTVLTRMQANAGMQSTTSVFKRMGLAAATTSLRGMVSNFGASSLWRGSSCMIGAVPFQNALLMTGYGWGKRWSDDFGGEDRASKMMAVFVGGCFGGVLQSFVMSPVELVKVTQQVAGASASSATTNVARGLFSNAGAWRGLSATMLRDGIPHGVWFASYEYAKTSLALHNSRSEGSEECGKGETDVAIPMLSGAFAATTAWLVGYPADLIKTRIQAGSGYRGILDVTRELIRESGGRPILGLYRGLTLKLCRAIPASAIGFLTYETAAKFLSSE